MAQASPQNKDGEPSPAPSPVIANQSEDWCGNPSSPAPTPVPSSQTVTVNIPILKRGATGTAVESAQLLLIHRGYDCGGRKNLLGRETPDGDFGPATEKAVRDFQTKTALAPDGEIGTDTWAALLRA